MTDGTDGVESPGDLDEARGWIGSKLDEMGGASVGRVEGLLVDAREGAPTWLVVKASRFGRRCAVPAEFAAAGVGHVWVPFDREMIRSASSVDPSGGLSCADERALSAHFGIPAGTGRLAEIEDVADDEPGSVPLG